MVPGPLGSSSLLSEQITTMSPTAAAVAKIRPGMKLTEVFTVGSQTASRTTKCNVVSVVYGCLASPIGILLDLLSIYYNLFIVIIPIFQFSFLSLPCLGTDIDLTDLWIRVCFHQYPSPLVIHGLRGESGAPAAGAAGEQAGEHVPGRHRAGGGGQSPGAEEAEG